MSVRIQLENGKIKEYSTYWDDSTGESGSTSYYSKCGLKWDKWPGKSGGCDHIDCAIRVTKTNTTRLSGVSAMYICMLIASIWFSGGDHNDWGYVWFSGAFLGIFYIIYFWDSNKAKRELSEFRDQGTIHGINGKQL
jgi:hypothetical protein